MQKKWKSSISAWGKQAHLCGYQTGSSEKHTQAVIGNTLSPFSFLFLVVSTYCQFLSSHWLTQSSPWKRQVLKYLQQEHTIDSAAEKLLIYGGKCVSVVYMLLHSGFFCFLFALCVSNRSLAPSLGPTWSAVVARLLFNINLHFLSSAEAKHMNFKAFITTRKTDRDDKAMAWNNLLHICIY